ncbi:MAG: hypothetical protein AB8H86_13625 [Polyangiales bacterium]
MHERDSAQELRAGGGCLIAVGVLFALSFGATWRSLSMGAESVHPLLWPVWKLGGKAGVLGLGVALVSLCVGVGLFALRRARR